MLNGTLLEPQLGLNILLKPSYLYTVGTIINVCCNRITSLRYASVKHWLVVEQRNPAEKCFPFKSLHITQRLHTHKTYAAAAAAIVLLFNYTAHATQKHTVGPDNTTAECRSNDGDDSKHACTRRFCTNITQLCELSVCILGFETCSGFYGMFADNNMRT